MSRHLSTRNINFESLELRRLRQDLMFTYKLVGLECSFEKVHRGHGYKLFLPTCHSSTRFNSFAYIRI